MKIEEILVKYNLSVDEIKKTKYSNYYITSHGRIINNRGHMLKLSIDRNGYSTYTISMNGTPIFVQLHRLVLETFNPIENCEKMMVNHIDGNKSNNELLNLEWCTRSENTLHSYSHGLQKEVTNQYGTYRVLTPEEKIFIRDNYANFTQKELSIKFGVSTRTIRKYKEY